MKQSKDSLRPALYARVSSDQQAEAGTIASQVDGLEERVRQDGLLLEPEMRFLDEGYSGSTLIRPALERLRDLAAGGGIDRLYVHSPDRLARKYAHQVLLVEELQRCGVELIFLNRELGRSPEDDLLLQVQGMVAEYERAKILERSRRGKLHAARRGSVNVLSGAPYGYRYVSKQEGGGKARYEIVLEEARVVRQIFDWVGRGQCSLAEVCRCLKKQGVPSPTGKPSWDRTTVWGLLKNPAYQGQAGFGKTQVGERRQRLRPPRGKAEQPRRAYSVYDTPERGVPIAVPALVSEELFAAVAEQLSENRARQRQQARGARYLLQGLLVCKRCGYAFYGKPVSRCAAKGKKRRYAYYRCIGTDAYRFGGERLCQNKQVRTDLLEAAVWDDVCALLKNPGRIEAEYQRRLSRKDADQEAKDSQQLVSLIQKVKRGIARLIDAYGEGLLDKSEFEPRIREFRERLARLEGEAKQQADLEAQERELRLVIGRLQEFAARVKEGLDGADWSTRREIIRTLVKRVEVDQGEVLVIYRVSLAPFVDRPERGSLPDCWKGAHAALRGAPMLVLVPGGPLRPPLRVGFFDRRLQPHLHQMQHVPIAEPPRHRLHQFGVGDAVEIPAQVRIDDVRIALIEPGLHRPHRVLRAAAGPVSKLLRRQIGLEDRLQDQHHRHLHHPVADGGNPQRPLLAVRLRNPHPPHRVGPIRLAFQFLRQCAQPPLRAGRFDVRERLAIHPRRAAVGPAACVGVTQHVRAIHLVVQRVEAIARRLLRFRVQCRLKLLNRRGSC